jgi:tetratricopeptide (TPR) repeat protein
LAAAIVAGCASPVSPRDSATFERFLDQGDYRAAAAAAEQAGRISADGQTQSIVWALNAASALYDSGDMKTAIPILDTTERLARTDDPDRMHATLDYRYTTYDGVMTNIYKAMSFLALGDRDSARVEFNRSEDRQRRAEEYFRKEIAYQAAHNQAASSLEFGNLMQRTQGSPDYAGAAGQLGEIRSRPTSRAYFWWPKATQHRASIGCGARPPCWVRKARQHATLRGRNSFTWRAARHRRRCGLCLKTARVRSSMKCGWCCR